MREAILTILVFGGYIALYRFGYCSTVPARLPGAGAAAIQTGEVKS